MLKFTSDSENQVNELNNIIKAKDLYCIECD